MNISNKISMYCDLNDLTDTEFAESVGVTKQLLSNMMNGRSRFTIDVLKLIRKNHPAIDINKLLDDDLNDFLVQENVADYGKDQFKKRLSEDVDRVISLLEKYK